MMTLLGVSDEELRRSTALLCHDALRWTDPMSSRVSSELRAILRRLALDVPLTIDDEQQFARDLLAAGAKLTGPYQRLGAIGGRWVTPTDDALFEAFIGGWEAVKDDEDHADRVRVRASYEEWKAR